MATKQQDKPLVDPNDPLVVVAIGGVYASFMLPMSKAKEFASLVMAAERVEWEYNAKGWKPSGTDNNVEFKQVSLAQYTSYLLAKSEVSS